jgi:4'-phosphopantetheinyl transferase
MNNLFYPQLIDRKLIASEIHVWYCSMELPVSRFWKMLSLDERTRAEQYHFQDDKDRFIIRRGILRTLLGRYLNVEPGQLQFCYGKNGKPGITDPSGRTEVHFNLSQSEELALYVFSRDNEIGVDIECIQDIPEMERITELYFSAGEREIFHTLPEDKKKGKFFNIWTRKEAIVKALGEGLSWPLDQLDVSSALAGPIRLQKAVEDTKPASRWSVQDLKPAPGFAAALATEGPIRRVSCWHWLN